MRAIEGRRVGCVNHERSAKSGLLRHFPFLVFPITIVATILGGNPTGTAPVEEEPWNRLKDVESPRGQRREVM